MSTESLEEKMLDLDLADETGGASSSDPVVMAPAPEAPKGGFWAAIRSAPWSAKLSLFWLTLVVFGAIYAKVDRWLSDPTVADPHQGLPGLQDAFYQGSLWGTASRVEGPSLDHFLGTDELSRDTFARIVAGGWVSLIVALTAVAFGIVVGGFIGSFAGYVQGKPETILMSAVDVILASPACSGLDLREAQPARDQHGDRLPFDSGLCPNSESERARLVQS